MVSLFTCLFLFSKLSRPTAFTNVGYLTICFCFFNMNYYYQFKFNVFLNGMKKGSYLFDYFQDKYLKHEFVFSINSLQFATQREKWLIGGKFSIFLSSA